MLVLETDQIPEEGLQLAWNEEVPSVMAYVASLSRIDFAFEQPLHTEAKVLKVGQSFFLKGNVKTTLRLTCVRCLNDFSFPISSSFDLTLSPLKKAPTEEEIELKEEDMESNFFEGGEIHLSEIACEQVFLEIPYKPLCHEDCRGLCPVCGKDLNLSACHCVPEGSESAFSALKDLKLS
jgi:uncharacterized protein